MKFEVTILGCSSATPTKDRHPSAQVLQLGETYILIDCGEGTQNRLMDMKISHTKLSYIFISHMHADHYLGIIGLLATINFVGRTTPLHVYGPEALEKIVMDHFKYSNTFVKFPLIFHVVNHGEKEHIVDNEVFDVYTLPLTHRIETNGFLFKEKKRLKKLNIEACKKHGIPFVYYDDIKAGKDFVNEKGESIANELLTFPSLKTRKYAYCSDTLFLPEIAGLLEEPDMLYHESTFMQDLEARALETFHSTSIQAATMANLSKTQRLLLGHFSARYSDLSPLLAEAKTVFENSYLALEGERFSIT